MANCLFCRIIAGEIPASKVHETIASSRSTTSIRRRRCTSSSCRANSVATLNDLTADDDGIVGELVRRGADRRRRRYAAPGFRPCSTAMLMRDKPCSTSICTCLRDASSLAPGLRSASCRSLLATTTRDSWRSGLMCASCSPACSTSVAHVIRLVVANFHHQCAAGASRVRRPAAAHGSRPVRLRLRKERHRGFVVDDILASVMRSRSATYGRLLTMRSIDVVRSPSHSPWMNVTRPVASSRAALASATFSAAADVSVAKAARAGHSSASVSARQPLPVLPRR